MKHVCFYVICTTVFALYFFFWFEGQDQIDVHEGQGQIEINIIETIFI